MFFNSYQTGEGIKASKMIEHLSINIIHFYMDTMVDRLNAEYPIKRVNSMNHNNIDSSNNHDDKVIRRPRLLTDISFDPTNPRYFTLGSVALGILFDQSLLTMKNSDGMVLEPDSNFIGGFKQLKGYYV